MSTFCIARLSVQWTGDFLMGEVVKGTAMIFKKVDGFSSVYADAKSNSHCMLKQHFSHAGCLLNRVDQVTTP